jgi:hypothetical protein
MAFHPGYAANGRFFVHYTDGAGANRIVEYAVSDDDPNRADPTSARTLLLTVPQPASNHNGGMIAFGPDGRMYVAVGRRGRSGDPHRNGQNPSTILGTITALDVDSGATSLFAYGLRNPWRFSWDGQRMYIGDVGQEPREEIDVLSAFDAGANLGWPLMEGTRCFTGGVRPQGWCFPCRVRPQSGLLGDGRRTCTRDRHPRIRRSLLLRRLLFGFRSLVPLHRCRRGTHVVEHADDGLVVLRHRRDGELYVVSIGGTVARWFAVTWHG